MHYADVLVAVADDHGSYYVLEEYDNHGDEVVAAVADADGSVEAMTDNSYRRHNSNHHAVHSLQKANRVPLNK